MEIWKDVPGYEGLYQVSDIGRVKSVERKVSNGKSFRVVKEKIFKPQFDGNRYLYVTLSRNRYKKNYRIHKLVVMAFLGNNATSSNLVVDHKDNNPLNNNLNNLQLITSRENTSKDRINTSSKYVGVTRRKNKWEASIGNKGVYTYLGSFDDEKEASLYYVNALEAIKNNSNIVVKESDYRSKYKGCSYSKRLNKWIAKITHNKKSIILGYFEKEQEAIIYYQNALISIKKGIPISRKVKKSSSNYKGVSWSSQSGKWKSSISRQDKSIHLGYFDNEYEAYLAYQAKLKEITNTK